MRVEHLRAGEGDEVINRLAAKHDIKRAGAEVRLIDGQLFQVKLIAPADPINLMAWITNDILMRNAWRGMRTTGTNPTLWDTGDPDTLARLVEANHDSPDADMLGHYTTEQ